MAIQKLSEFIEHLNYNLQQYGDGEVYMIDDDGNHVNVDIEHNYTYDYKWDEEKKDLVETNVKHFYEILTFFC